MLYFSDFIQVFVFTTNHHLKTSLYEVTSPNYANRVCGYQAPFSPFVHTDIYSAIKIFNYQKADDKIFVCKFSKKC